MVQFDVEGGRRLGRWKAAVSWWSLVAARWQMRCVTPVILLWRFPGCFVLYGWGKRVSAERMRDRERTKGEERLGDNENLM
jgi:hypothetical protein